MYSRKFCSQRRACGELHGLREAPHLVQNTDVLRSATAPQSIHRDKGRGLPCGTSRSRPKFLSKELQSRRCRSSCCPNSCRDELTVTLISVNARFGYDGLLRWYLHPFDSFTRRSSKRRSSRTSSLVEPLSLGSELLRRECAISTAISCERRI